MVFKSQAFQTFFVSSSFTKSAYSQKPLFFKYDPGSSFEKVLDNFQAATEEKLKSLNLFGNKIKEIDFAQLFTKFPNLEIINLQVVHSAQKISTA